MDIFHATEPAGVEVYKHLLQAYVSLKPTKWKGFEFDFGKLEFAVDGPTTRRQKLYQDALIADLPELLKNLPKLEELLAADRKNKELREAVRKQNEIIDWCWQEMGKRNIRRMTYEKLAKVTPR